MSKANNKGVALMIALLVLLFLSILSAAAFMRYAAEQGTSVREKALAQAFYNAEEGLNYAYAELNQHDFDWNTHKWQGTTTLIPNSVTAGITQGRFYTDGSYYIEDSQNPHYFKAITYPELDAAGVPNGITIIHSQGTDPKATTQRTVELRVSKNSMFDYFYFFPTDHIFNGGTYDGGGYGKIHVNGKITLSNYPKFQNITEISTANIDHNGYFVLSSSQYTSPKSYDGSTIDGIAALSKSSSPPYAYSLAGNSDLQLVASKFTSSSVTAKFDGVNVPSTFPTEWPWDKYSGERASDEVPISFKISNDALNWLTYDQGDPASGTKNKYLLTPAQYAQLNSDYKTNPDGFWNNIYRPQFTDSNTDTKGNLAQEFWHAAFNTTGTPNNVNTEWWEDLTYGNDRSLGDNIEVNYLNSKEQSAEWQSWLNSQTATITKVDTGATETQPLSSVIKDSANGGQYLVPIRLQTNYKRRAEDDGLCLLKGQSDAYLQWSTIPHQVVAPAIAPETTGEVLTFTVATGWVTAYYQWKDRHPSASSTEIYDCRMRLMQEWSRINSDPNKPSSAIDWNSQAKTLQQQGIIQLKQFYNPVRQPGSYGYLDFDQSIGNTQGAKPAQVLEIDVEKLRQYLTDNGQAFNGVIYVESADPNDTSSGISSMTDLSVLVKNAGILPENGLSLVTPHNIYAQGSFNLDYDRDGASEAYTYYKSQHSSQTNDNDYQWRPGALISSQRIIYTISDNFQKNQTINSLADISSYNYWEAGTKSTSYSYPNSLNSSNFVTNYLDQAINDNGVPAAVISYCTNYGITMPSDPSGWTVDFIKNNFNPANPEAAKAQKALLDLGEQRYDTQTEATQPNRVLYDVIYNTAMITPYDPEGATLERWIDASGNTKKRQITGSLIQLEDIYRGPVACVYQGYNKDGVLVYQIESGYYMGSTTRRVGYNNWHGYVPQYSGWYNPSSFYNYEPNFATDSSSNSNSTLSVSGMVSWLEIPNADFCPKCQ